MVQGSITTHINKDTYLKVSNIWSTSSQRLGFQALVFNELSSGTTGTGIIHQIIMIHLLNSFHDYVLLCQRLSL